MKSVAMDEVKNVHCSRLMYLSDVILKNEISSLKKRQQMGGRDEVVRLVT
jgi:hypothetical protein